MTPLAAIGWAIRLVCLPQCVRKGSSSNAVLLPQHRDLFAKRSAASRQAVLPGTCALSVPDEGHDSEPRQDQSTDQRKKSPRQQLHSHPAVLGRACIGECSEAGKRCKSQDQQRDQHADHSNDEKDPAESLHGLSSSGSTHGPFRMDSPTGARNRRLHGFPNCFRPRSRIGAPHSNPAFDPRHYLSNRTNTTTGLLVQHRRNSSTSSGRKGGNCRL